MFMLKTKHVGGGMILFLLESHCLFSSEVWCSMNLVAMFLLWLYGETLQ
jgi:hypothetical protein